MNPTPRLRFVERSAPIFGSMMSDGMGNTVTTQQTIRILQQWWEGGWGPMSDGEWRDVPLEQE